jgi:hypothetical protein
VDNKNSALNLLEEMKQYLNAADELRQKMDEKLRALCGQDPGRGGQPAEPEGDEDR